MKKQTNTPSFPGPARPWIGLAAILALAGLFVTLTVTTWLKWGDPVIDTGRELEIPWKIARGELLYRDMVYNYGPFSPYVNAAFIKILGARFTSLAASGLICAALGTVLVVLLTRFFLGLLPGLLLGAAFLFECAFQHYFLNGNFNFVVPYAWPAVHALLAGLGALVLMNRRFAGGGRGWLAGAGLLGGVALLCKVEIAAALLAALAAGPLVARIRSGLSLKAALLDGVAWAAPLIVVTVVGFLPFMLATSFEDVFWRNVFKPQLVDFRSSIFFLEALGVEGNLDPAGLEENLRLLFVSLLFWAGVTAAGVFTARVLLNGPAGDGPRRALIAAGILGALCVAIWFVLPDAREFHRLQYRCLPVAGLAGIITGLLPALLAKRTRPSASARASAASERHDGAGGRGAAEGRHAAGRRDTPKGRDAALAALSLFALLCLVRILLKAGTFHYGFCLALPGMILLPVLAARLGARWIPLMRRARGRAWIALFLTGLCCLLGARNFLGVSMEQYRYRTLPLEGPGGTMMISGFFHETLAIKDAFDHLLKTGRPGDILVVLPEGAVLNFLSGQINPLSYDLFIPPELTGPGVEDAVVAQLVERRPDRILVVPRNVREYGYETLGRDGYGEKLMAHVMTNYEEEERFSLESSGDGPGRCLLYRRKGD